MADRPLFIRLSQALWPIAASALSLLAFYAVGRRFVWSYTLDLGSMGLPSVRHVYFLLFWTILGSTSAAFLAVGLTRLQALAPRAVAWPAELGDATWVAVTMAAAFAVACTIRAFVLRGAVVTDDESAYRFMAQVLASGRLFVDSHPMKAFFDRVFMINDGKFYGQYFIGWPALMVPGVYVGATGYMNAFYSALTVPAVFLTVRRMAGSAAGRVATILYLVSPMLAVGAATELSHTTCLMAAAWSVYCLLRSWEAPRDWRWHAGVAFCFSLGFLIRPLSTLGVGLPILAGWFVHVIRQSPGRRRRAIVAFAVPALAMAALLFAVNVAQNGSALTTSYARSQQYMREVNFVNVGWSVASPPTSLMRYILGTGEWELSLARTAIGLVRLVFDLFGSPLILVLVGLAWTIRPARIVWLSALSFVVVHFSLSDSGVDTFGPVHFYELALPLVVLAGVGFGRLASLAREWQPALPSSWAPHVVGALIVVSLVGFVPVRLITLEVIASNVNAPEDALKAAGISHAVIFTAGLFVDQQCIAPTRHFVYFHPNNDPRLRNDILWANHLDWQDDIELMKKWFPDRNGYVMKWEGCRPRFQHLE
jgi:hypothetical protein